MIKKVKLKKGATLIELSIVLAVLSIISAMVVSFTVFFNARTATTVKANSLMQDVVSIKAVVESWVDEHTKNDATITCDDNRTSLIASIDGKDDCFISLTDKVLSGKLADDNTLSCKVEIISDLVFNIVENSNQTQTLYICKASYFVDNSLQYFSFTINPFVGDVVAKGA